TFFTRSALSTSGLSHGGAASGASSPSWLTQLTPTLLSVGRPPRRSRRRLRKTVAELRQRYRPRAAPRSRASRWGPAERRRSAGGRPAGWATEHRAQRAATGR